MAKRFTDTDKWKRSWFYDLSPHAKLAWVYLLDQCDHRGVWPANFKLMSQQLGYKVDETRFESWFGEKVALFDLDKYFIRSFVDFQYGELHPNNNAHKAVIDLIHRVEKGAPDQGLGSPTPGAQDKDKEEYKKKRTNQKPKFDFEAAYKKYPRKAGKSRGLKICIRDVNTPEDYELLCLAIERYAEHCRAKRTGEEFIMHFVTFMGEWRDWTDPSHGTAINTEPQHYMEL